jgi:hypothetical protein
MDQLQTLEGRITDDHKHSQLLSVVITKLFITSAERTGEMLAENEVLAAPQSALLLFQDVYLSRNLTMPHSHRFLTHEQYKTLCSSKKKKNSVTLESELYQPSNHRSLVPTFEVRECCVICATDPHGCIFGFIDRNRYFLFHVAPQL